MISHIPRYRVEYSAGIGTGGHRTIDDRNEYCGTTTMSSHVVQQGEENQTISGEFLQANDVVCGSQSAAVLESVDEEVEEESDGSSLFSIDFDIDINQDRVFVAVGKTESSMNALSWTLKHAVVSPSSTVVYLLHVFPVIRFVPSPRGMLPKSQANPKLVKIYMAQQRDKRRKLLQKYIEACSSTKVKVETLVVESGIRAKAILELISTFNIKKLVLGSTKSSLRKMKSKRGTASQILQNAPETCEIKICRGKQVTDHRLIGSPSPSGSSVNSLSTQEEDQELVLSSPDIRKSPSVGTPVIWSSVFKWLRTKPSSTFGSSSQKNTLKYFSIV